MGRHQVYTQNGATAAPNDTFCYVSKLATQFTYILYIHTIHRYCIAYMTFSEALIYFAANLARWEIIFRQKFKDILKMEDNYKKKQIQEKKYKEKKYKKNKELQGKQKNNYKQKIFFTRIKLYIKPYSGFMSFVYNITIHSITVPHVYIIPVYTTDSCCITSSLCISFATSCCWGSTRPGNLCNNGAINYW